MATRVWDIILSSVVGFLDPQFLMTLKLLLTILHRRRDQEVYSFNSRMPTLVQEANFHLYVLGEGTVKESFKKFALCCYLQKDPAKNI